MNKIFSYILRIYIYLSLILGFFLSLYNTRYLLGYLIGLTIGLVDFSLLYISFKKRKSLSYTGVIWNMLLRILIVILILLLLSIYGIINRLNIVGLIFGIIVYPIVLFIGGIRILRWKK